MSPPLAAVLPETLHQSICNNQIILFQNIFEIRIKICWLGCSQILKDGLKFYIPVIQLCPVLRSRMKKWKEEVKSQNWV